jgi:hypothetical protein
MGQCQRDCFDFAASTARVDIWRRWLRVTPWPPSAPAPGLPPHCSSRLTRRVETYEYALSGPDWSRQSALLPFKTMNIERLSIFNATTDRGNPRLGARFENNTDIPFEAGPVTFFQDTRYSGEAVLDYLPRGEKALVSYGVDYDVQIAGKQQTQPESTVRLTVSKVLLCCSEAVQTTTYETAYEWIRRR